LNSVNLVRVVVRARGPTGASPGVTGTAVFRVRGVVLVPALALFEAVLVVPELLARLVDVLAMWRYLVG
jgi:hypothetical protein